MATKIVYNYRGNHPEHKPAPTGSKFNITRQIVIDEKGHKTLEKTGQTNRYEKIQAQLESTKIENILQRAIMGDTSALDRVRGQYLDTTEYPTNLIDAQNAMIKITNDFWGLPKEMRAKFDNSPDRYIREFGSKEWMNKIGLDKEIEKKTAATAAATTEANETATETKKGE